MITENDKKPSIVYHNTDNNYFKKSTLFPQNWGTWVLTSIKGAVVESENIDELYKYPGITITNTNHQYGYKYNRLQNHWSLYDFDQNIFL